MVQIRDLKNGKKVISSSCWKDIKTYTSSLKDAKTSDWEGTKGWKWRSTDRKDFSEVELATAIETLKLAKQGAAEVSQFVKELSPEQLKSYAKADYGPLKEYESYEDMIEKKNTLESLRNKSEEDLKEIDRLNTEINEIDNFCEKEIEVSHNRSPESAIFVES